MPHTAPGRHSRRSRLRRAATWPFVDAAVWIAACYASVWLRYDFRLELLATWEVAAYALLAATLHLVAGTVVGPYRVRHRRGSFEEIADLGTTFAVILPVLLVIPWLTWPHPVPRTTAITAGTLALLTMLAARLLSRARHNRIALQRPRGRRALVYGAGHAGDRLVTSLLTEDDSTITPVALLDDDPAKSRLRIRGVRVVGGRESLEDAADQLDADVLVIAMPTASPEAVREISTAARHLGLDVLMLPSVEEVMGRTPTADDLRDLDLADVLGRPPVHLDEAAVSAEITGKTVLVTGAGGSIGSELARQIARFSPQRLVLLDRDESGLQATDMSIRGNGLLDGGNLALADIRDAEALRRIMATERPDIVYHAAALKHLPLLESHPLEAWKSNVVGTLNVLRAADEAGVPTFVNISTDKAADPTSVLGQSKRLAELLTAWYAQRPGHRYVSVRFGNVLGSRGSVVHAFTTQIRRGGPLTVTHPDVERYFMLIPEACQLVLQAGLLGTAGEVMVLEMGEQVRIVDLAQTLIDLSGRNDIEIVFTGLRPGEKLAEELFGHLEAHAPTAHPLIDAVSVPVLDPAALADMGACDDAAARAWMRRTVDAHSQPAAGFTQAAASEMVPLRSAPAGHSGHSVHEDAQVTDERGGAHVLDIPRGLGG